MIRRGLIYLGDAPGVRRLITGTPLSRLATRRFVPGETVHELVDAIRRVNAQGLRVTANYLGESVREEVQARAAAGVYLELLERIREDGLDANLSVKLTQLGQDVSPALQDELLGAVLDRAGPAGVFIRLDMESSDHTTRTLETFEALWAGGRRNVGVVLQAYLRRTAGDVRRMIALGARVRLCKGAYAEPPEVAYQEMSRIRANFEEMARWLLAEGTEPAIATHDERLIRSAVDFARAEGIGPDRFEFQMLYGVRRDLQRELAEAGFNVRVYIPFGEEWYPYLLRRLAERPENMLFVAGSVVKESPLGFLWPRGRGADLTAEDRGR